MLSSIYWNSHRKVWSIRQKGLIVGHATSLVLENVIFRVSETGRQRVIREKRKSVHAIVRGKRVPLKRAVQCAIRVRYNPYRDKTFVTKKGRIDRASLASFRSDGTVYVQA